MLSRDITLLVSFYLLNIVFCKESCWEDFGRSRKHYNGTIDRTMSGKLCQRWDSQTPHAHVRNEEYMFPDDASVSNASNYCRDNFGNGDIYCYTTDPDVILESCSIPDCSDPFGYHMVTVESDFMKCRYVPENGECDFNEEFVCRYSTYHVIRSQLARENCKDLVCCERRGCRDGESQEYDGQWSTTYNGYTCRFWGGYLQKTPEPDNFPEKSLLNASNYCRDPDLRGNTWCYTNRRGFRGVFIPFSCKIPSCDTYVLPQYFDHTCYEVTDKDIAMYSNGSSEDDKAICESVDGRVYLPENDYNYPGCTNCSCCQMKGCYHGDSRDYKGNWGISANGLRCKRWTDTCIGRDDALFPDDTVADASNYCRHTSIHDDRGLWCYTDDPDIPEDNCDVPQCDPLPTESPAKRTDQTTTTTTATTTTTTTTTTATASRSSSNGNVTSNITEQTTETSRGYDVRRTFPEVILTILLVYLRLKF